MEHFLKLCFCMRIFSLAETSYPLQSSITLRTPEGSRVLLSSKANHELVFFHQGSYELSCNSSRAPVSWSYVGEGAPSHFSANVGRSFLDFYNVHSYTHQAILTLHSLHEGQSGRYTCRANSEPSSLEIHYDIFVPVEQGQVLLSLEEKTVYVEYGEIFATLPCPVSDPSAGILLYKKNNWGEDYAQLGRNDSIAFRPRVGFLLRLEGIPAPYGTYICSTPDRRWSRRIHLLPNTAKPKEKTELSPLKMSFDSGTNQMICCAPGGRGKPNLQSTSCTSLLECRIKSVCFEGARCGAEDDASALPMGNSCSAQRLPSSGGIFKCSANSTQSPLYQPYFWDKGQIYLHFGASFTPPSESILSLVPHSTHPVGGVVEYECSSARFFFATGIRWAWKRAGGIDFIDDDSPVVLRDAYGLGGNRRRTKFRIVHDDIQAIICFVPVANSPTEWRTVSLPIKPKVYETTQERVGNLNLNPAPSSQTKSRARLGLTQSVEVDPNPSLDIDEIMAIGPQEHASMEYDKKRNRGATHPLQWQIPEEIQQPHPQQSVLHPDIITIDDIRGKAGAGADADADAFAISDEIQKANILHQRRFHFPKETPRATYPPPQLNSYYSLYSPHDKEYQVASMMSLSSEPGPEDRRAFRKGAIISDRAQPHQPYHHRSRPSQVDIEVVPPPPFLPLYKKTTDPTSSHSFDVNNSPWRRNNNNPVIYYDEKKGEYGLREQHHKPGRPQPPPTKQEEAEAAAVSLYDEPNSVEDRGQVYVTSSPSEGGGWAGGGRSPSSWSPFLPPPHYDYHQSPYPHDNSSHYHDYK